MTTASSYTPSSARARGLRLARLGLLVNAVLVAVKVTAGVLGNSYALVADGVESSLDIFSSLIVVRGLTIAGRTADERYHFGYAKAESVSSAAVAVMLLIAAIGISIQAIREILTPHHVPAPFTLAVLVGVIVTKELLFRSVLHAGTEIGSLAVKADAWHHRSDAITSAAAFIGIAIALVGGEAWASADDWAALLASGLIAWNGYRLLRPALEDLMDRAPDDDAIHAVRTSAASVEGVRRVEKALVRRAGVGYFITLHIEADADMPLREAHYLGHVVKDRVMTEVPTALDVIVHMEPHR
ncbi:MAG TPA: cation diffusion facilitator family transporter [Longimicrobiales bacterium]